jgi:hypothetical protein
MPSTTTTTLSTLKEPLNHRQGKRNKKKDVCTLVLNPSSL